MPKFLAAWLRKFADPGLHHENNLQDQRIGELMRENSRLSEEVELVNNQLSYALDLLGEDKTDFTERCDGSTPEKVRGAVVEARVARGQATYGRYLVDPDVIAGTRYVIPPQPRHP